MYESNTFEAVLKRMLDATPSDIDKREGSVTRDMLSPAAIELTLAYIELDNVLKFGFADTTYGEYLDRRVSEMGLTREIAEKATGELTFTGATGTVVPVGTRVYNNSTTPIYFVTTAEGTIPVGATTVIVDAKAELAGKSGNVPANTITVMVNTVSGITTVNNGLSFNGGKDKETDADLLKRYLNRTKNPATSGNSNHYKLWALEVVGVGDAKVFPVWNGNGTVKVVIIDDLKTGADSTLVTSVTNHIEESRPVGATVTVISATELAINISATITLATGKTLTDAQTEIQSTITDYLKSLAFVDSIVRYNEIGRRVLDCTSVADYSNLTVNSGTINIDVAAEQVAVIGTVSLV